METFEEWRVTGTPDDDDQPYDFRWSPDVNPHITDPERSARKMMGLLSSTQSHGWLDGPTLRRRTVVKGPWEVLDG